MRLFTKSKSILSSLHGATTQAPIRRIPMLVEELEPRILHSADIGPALLHDGSAVPQVETRVLDAGGEFSANAVQTQQAKTELVIVDSRTPDYQQLVDDIRSEAADGRQIEVVLLDNHSNGIDQITALLSGRKDIGAIHIISHGSEGEVQLGGSVLDLRALRAHTGEIESWANALTPDADLLIYGCNVAGSPDGRTLVDALSRLTGADVAASENLTGNAAAGGDWNFEYATGRIETALAIDARTQQAWAGVLANTAPVLSGAENLTTIAEDPAANPGTQVSALLAGHVTDPDTGALPGIAVTATDNTNGNWQYSIDAGGSWNNLGNPSDTSARLLRSTDFVRFVPNADFNGTVNNGLSFHAWDQTIGTAGTAVDTTANAFNLQDTFSTASYSNNNGTANFSAAWVDSDGDPNNGSIKITGGQLEMTTLIGGGTIYREANLAAAGPGTMLSFDYSNQILISLGGNVELQISSNGGASYSNLATFSSSQNAGTGTFSQDISAFTSANMRLRLVSSGISLPQVLNIDNLQISYVNNPYSTATASSSITVTAANDPPAGANNTVSAVEDGSYTFAAADFGFGDTHDTPANNFLAVTITTLPGAGSLTLNGAAVAAGQSISAADVTAGNLQFAPAANGNGAGYSSFTFQVQDDGGGTSLDVTARTMTIDVTAVNDPPAGTSNTVTAPEDGSHVFSTTDFGFTDPADAPVNSLLAVQITTLPGAGSLTLNSVAVTTGQFVAASDITAGNLVFTPAAGVNGAGYASFTFQVQDNGGGADLDPVARTMIIDVAAVNDPPIGANNTVSTAEDNAHTFTASEFGFSDPGDAPANILLAVRIATLPGAGSLTLNGAAVTAGQFVLASDIASGDLVFTPGTDANGTGYASFTFQVQDDGGGADLDIVARTMTIDVTAANDAPILATNAGITLNEGASATITAASLHVTDIDNTATQLVFTVTTAPANGHLELSTAAGVSITSFTQDDIDNNHLIYVHGGSQTTSDSFSFAVSDSAGGNIGTSAFAIAVAAIDDAPVNSVPGTQATNQDTVLVFSTAGGNTISISDVDAGSSAVQLTLSASNGTVTLATTTGLIFSTGTGTGDATMQFSGSVAAINTALNGLRFNPDAGFTGAAALSIVTDDLGNTGSGGPLTASSLININVAVTPVSAVTTPAIPIIDPIPVPVPPATVVDPVLPPSATPAPTAGPVAPTFDEVPSAGGTVEPEASPPFDLATGSGRSVSYTLTAPSTRNGRAFGVSYTLPAAQWLMFGDEPAAGLTDGSASSFGLGTAGDGHGGLQSPALIDALDRLREGLQEQSRADALIVATTAAASLGLSVGYVLWLLRGGVLISSMLSSLPAWRLVDPLPILGRLDDEDEDADDDSIESLLAAKNAAPIAQPVVPAEPANTKSLIE